MFTGIVKALGTVGQSSPTTEGKRLKIYCEEMISDMEIDDSVALNGVCQTIVTLGKDYFEVDTVHVTLEKTSLGQLRPGEKVNLELALRPMDRMGGHFVQGHVNGLGKLLKINSTCKNFEVDFGFPKELGKYIVREGSITIDGISLTVANVNYENQSFTVSIIPHTWENTIFSQKKVGHMVNLEVDILAKYIENLLFHGHGRTHSNSKISEDWLRSKGF